MEYSSYFQHIVGDPQIERVTLKIYAPRSGAARLAIERGDDPAPLLLDVAVYGLTYHVWARAARAWLEGQEMSDDEVVALGSRLILRNGDEGHLLLLDFRVPPSAAAEKDLLHYLDYLGWSGWLIASGASYHFVGREILDHENWRLRMARALLIPGIDERCSAHALHNSEGGLRLSACRKKPHVPVVVATLGVPRGR